MVGSKWAYIVQYGAVGAKYPVPPPQSQVLVDHDQLAHPWSCQSLLFPVMVEYEYLIVFI